MKRINLTFLLFVFLLTLAVNTYAQTPKCYVCKSPIKGEYIEAEGKTFHKNHFKCSKCFNVIEGKFYVKDGKFYHPKCFVKNEGLICKVCKNTIEGKFYENDGNKYHPNCFEKFIAKKCNVCGGALNGQYYTDYYGNNYHVNHANELKKCFACDRLICKSITNGGRVLSDNRTICNECFSSAVYSNSDYENLLKEVSNKLNQYGIKLNPNRITIQSVDKKTLARVSKESFSSNIRGFCDTQIRSLIGIESYKHKIYVLNYMPKLTVKSVIAHELMHVWINENAINIKSKSIIEGTCNFISFTYLKKMYSSSTKYLLKELELNPDPVYGNGFRKIKSRFENKPISNLLAYLKKTSAE